MIEIISSKESLQFLFDTALFGSKPLFTENYIQFSETGAKIADISLNTMGVYAEFDKEFFTSYEFKEDQPYNLVVTSDLQSALKHLESSKDLTLKLDGKCIQIIGENVIFEDDTKILAKETGHLPPDKFKIKMVMGVFGFLPEKINNNIDKHAKILITSEELRSIPNTSAEDYSVSVSKDEFKVIAEASKEGTWRLQKVLKTKSIDVPETILTKVPRNSLEKTLSSYSGDINLTLDKGAFYFTQNGKSYHIFNFLGAIKPKA